MANLSQSIKDKKLEIVYLHYYSGLCTYQGSLSYIINYILMASSIKSRAALIMLEVGIMAPSWNISLWVFSDYKYSSFIKILPYKNDIYRAPSLYMINNILEESIQITLQRFMEKGLFKDKTKINRGNQTLLFNEKTPCTILGISMLESERSRLILENPGSYYQLL